MTGASLGLMAMLRPYDAVLVAIPIGVFQLVMLKRDRSLLRPIAIQVAVALAFASIQLLVNARTTGSPFLFAYDALNGAAHRPGFHTDPLGFPFTPAKGLDLVIRYLSRLNTGLFESVVPATLFIAGAMWLARPTKWDWLLTGLMFSVLVGYGSYWVDGTFLGPRFLYTALPAFVILSARFVALSSRAERGTRFWPGAALLLPACIALALVPSSIGHRSTGIWLRLDGLRRGPVAMTQNPLQDVGSASISNALVFVREPLHSRITARLRALGMAPFDAERTVSDMDACTLLAALARSDARPDLPIAQRRVTVFEEARKAGQGRSVPGLVGASALSITGGPQFTQECRDEIDGDRAGVEAFERFLAVSTFDDDGRLGGDIVFARYLGARDSILAADPRFSGRAWFLYHRNPGSRVGSFELIRRPGG